MTDNRLQSLGALFDKANHKLEGAGSALREGFYDDAVSRAYYAAFHAVSAALLSQGLSYNSHGRTLGAFNKEFVKSGRLPAGAFQKLQRLYEDRQDGDYSSTKKTDRVTAETGVADAGWIIEHCKAIIGQ